MSEQATEKVVCFVKPYTSGGKVWSDGTVMFASGPIVEEELRMQGRCLEDWMIDEIPEPGTVGVLVWEGVCENAWCHHHGSDWEPRLVGKWRKLTAVELWSLTPANYLNRETK